jgi:hypothetical protein
VDGDRGLSLVRLKEEVFDLVRVEAFDLKLEAELEEDILQGLGVNHIDKLLGWLGRLRLIAFKALVWVS